MSAKAACELPEKSRTFTNPVNKASRRTNLKVEFRDSPEFHDADADEKFLSRPICALESIQTPLSIEDERQCFLEMNYRRFVAKSRLTDKPIESNRLRTEALKIRDFLVRANSGLVRHEVARRCNNTDPLDLESRLWLRLMQAVDLHDTNRSRFSTFAVFSLRYEARQCVKDHITHGQRFCTGPGSDVWLEHLESEPIDSLRHDAGNVPRLLRVLECRQRAIIERRYGLDGGGFPTLAEIAAQFGISRERVRQIEAKALQRMRVEADRLGISPED